MKVHRKRNFWHAHSWNKEREESDKIKEGDMKEKQKKVANEWKIWILNILVFDMFTKKENLGVREIAQ